MAITKSGCQLDLSSSFTNPTSFEQNGRVTTIPVTGLDPSTRYYVRGYVISDGTTVYSQNISSFSTATPNYLSFANASGQSDRLLLTKEGSPTDIILEYSYDGVNWDSYDSGSGDLDIELEDGQKVQFRGTNATFSESEYDYYHFSSTYEVEVGGDIMTLVDEYGMSDTIPCAYCFCKLFLDWSTMENNGLEFPALTLEDYCYLSTFDGCTSMSNCPELPADTLTEGCYQRTFAGCEAISVSPVLVAPYLATKSYVEMFKGAISLQQIECYAEQWDISNAQDWVSGVNQSGTIYLSPNLPVGTGQDEIPADDDSGCPRGWAISQ